MIIKVDRFFSDIDENGEEKLYSYSEYMTEEQYLQKEFGLKDKIISAGKKLAETPEGQRILARMRMEGKRNAVRYKQAMQELYAGAAEQSAKNAQPIAQDLSSLVTRGAKKLSKGIREAGKTSEANANTVAKQIRGLKARDMFGY